MSTPDALRAALRGWFKTHARALPWRTQRSVYRTVVSEFMCQQTQIDTVLPYFARWMERFPDFDALAAAPEEVVLKHWEGLGYYSRARNLHKLARTYADAPADDKPRSAAQWLRLPGVGNYTAAAIASIAFDEPVAVVDGNVVRVLSRLAGLREPFANAAKAIERVRPIADALLDPQHPGQHNEALMELGALVCSKRQPRCALCPLRPHCAAGASDDPESIPAIQRAKTRKIERAHILCIHEGHILLQRAAGHARRLAHLHELPRAAPTRIPPTATPVETRTRGIANERIAESLFLIDCPRTAEHTMESPNEKHWAPIHALDALTLSGPHRRWILDLLARRHSRS